MCNIVVIVVVYNVTVVKGKWFWIILLLDVFSLSQAFV